MFHEEQPGYAPHFNIMMGGERRTIVGAYPLDPKRTYYFCGIAATPVRTRRPFLTHMQGPAVHACRDVDTL